MDKLVNVRDGAIGKAHHDTTAFVPAVDDDMVGCYAALWKSFVHETKVITSLGYLAAGASSRAASRSEEAAGRPSAVAVGRGRAVVSAVRR